jgi:hypothetical protein
MFLIIIGFLQLIEEPIIYKAKDRLKEPMLYSKIDLVYAKLSIVLRNRYVSYLILLKL